MSRPSSRGRGPSQVAASFSLEDLTALVTGAGGGIGAAIAAGLAQCGARVGCIDVGGERLDSVVGRIRSAGGMALGLPADVTDEQALDSCVARVEEELGPLRLAVNCAGRHSTAPAEELSRKAWQDVLDVNLTGVFLSCQAEGRAMLRNGGGSIVNVGSISASIANRGLQQAHYNSTKAGVVHLSRCLAVEWADRDVRVNAISPGYVRTPMSRAVTTTRSPQDFLDDIPMRRMGDPEEMVGPTIFLLSSAASYCTGTELVSTGE